MGLTSWTGGLPKRTDAEIAKNYLSSEELDTLNRISHFEMTRFLSEHIGAHEYKSPRTDGQQHFVIDQPLIDEFADIQTHQWDDCQLEMPDRIGGLFGENDHLAHFEPLFLQHYTHAHHFPGAHTPMVEEMREYYVLLVERLISNI